VVKEEGELASCDSEVDSGKSLHLPTPFCVLKLSGLLVLLDLA
jgi:hypothetical protein